MSEHTQEDEDGPQPVDELLRDMVVEHALDGAYTAEDGSYTVWRNGVTTSLDPEGLRALAAKNRVAARMWIILETEHLEPGETRSWPIFGDEQ